jgi:broad specificity phosphatase PhoE
MRLGQYFAENGIGITHLFASPLIRAMRTAYSIWEAQPPPATECLTIQQAPELMEQDFGSLEGVSWSKPPQLPFDANFVPVETKESVAARTDAFLEQHLLPILHSEPGSWPSSIAIVSHGITISILWQRLLKRFPKGNVAYASELGIDRPLEHFGGWSNTGYLEVDIQLSQSLTAKPPPGEIYMPSVGQSSTASPMTTAPASVDGAYVIDVTQGPRSLTNWSCTIKAVNSTEHLKNLKRTRGGIGSSRYDENQSSIDSFFRRS